MLDGSERDCIALQGAAANKVMGELLALEEEQLQSLLQLLQLTLSVLAAAQQASAQRCASYASLAAACRQQRSAIAPEDSHLQCQLQLLQPALAAAAVDPQVWGPVVVWNVLGASA